MCRPPWPPRRLTDRPRQAWREAALAFDRLAAADPTAPEAWLRTPGLLRLATALLHQDRPVAAALLLQGGVRRRIEDGLPAIERSGLGFVYEVTRGTARVTELPPEYPGSRAGLRVGDIIEKVNDTELTRESQAKLPDLLAETPERRSGSPSATLEAKNRR